MIKQSHELFQTSRFYLSAVQLRSEFHPPGRLVLRLRALSRLLGIRLIVPLRTGILYLRLIFPVYWNSNYLIPSERTFPTMMKVLVRRHRRRRRQFARLPNARCLSSSYIISTRQYIIHLRNIGIYIIIYDENQR